jgi:hypothetical protein
MYSMGINPNANTFSNILLGSRLDNRHTVIQSARIVLREILENQPEAFSSGAKPFNHRWRSVNSKLRDYLKADVALSVVAEGYTLFTYWRTCIDMFSSAANRRS